MSILRDQRSFVISRHAGLVTVMALGVVAVGLLVGFSAVALHESATDWILQA